MKQGKRQLNENWHPQSLKAGCRVEKIKESPEANPHFMNGKNRDEPWPTTKVVPNMPNKM